MYQSQWWKVITFTHILYVSADEVLEVLYLSISILFCFILIYILILYFKRE